MIIEMLLDVLYNVFSKLLVFQIPKLPAEVYQFIDEAFTYIEMGAGILANYTPLSYLLVLFGIVIAVDTAIVIYHFVLWILKKIPMAGIS